MKYKVLDALVLPRELRGQGRGSLIMQKLCGWADVEGVTLVLTADSTVLGRTGSPEEDARLVDFYESWGFEPSAFKRIYNDTIWSSKNIMERAPQPVLSDSIVRLADLITEEDNE